jgi:hypothetical protein
MTARKRPMAGKPARPVPAQAQVKPPAQLSRAVTNYVRRTVGGNWGRVEIVDRDTVIIHNTNTWRVKR